MTHANPYAAAIEEMRNRLRVSRGGHRYQINRLRGINDEIANDAEFVVLALSVDGGHRGAIELLEIRLQQSRVEMRSPAPRPVQPPTPAKPPPSRQQRVSVAPVAPTVAIPDLPRLDASFNMQIEIANPQAIVLEPVGLMA